MKNKKSIFWVIIAITSFTMVMIALFAVGFTFNSAVVGNNTLQDIIDAKGKPNLLAINKDVIESGVGLMIGGIVVASVFMALTIINLVLNFTTKKKIVSNKILDIVFVTIILLAIILTISGMAIYINEMGNSGRIKNLKLTAGSGFAIFFLVLLPVLLIGLPVFFGGNNKTNDNKQARIK